MESESLYQQYKLESIEEYYLSTTGTLFYFNEYGFIRYKIQDKTIFVFDIYTRKDIRGLKTLLGLQANVIQVVKEQFNVDEIKVLVGNKNTRKDIKEILLYRLGYDRSTKIDTGTWYAKTI